MLLFIGNTKDKLELLKKFQYISCYSLSFAKEILDIACKGFQYISCYSLSLAKEIAEWQLICFNTSHVTLYLSLAMCYLPIKACFNTSHVTLYPSRQSILQNPSARFNTSHVTLYQYEDLEEQGLLGFNTSHVTLYRRKS